MFEVGLMKWDVRDIVPHRISISNFTFLISHLYQECSDIIIAFLMMFARNANSLQTTAIKKRFVVVPDMYRDNKALKF